LLALTLKRKPRIKKLRVLAANAAVDLWAIDEVHFQQHGSRGRMWIPPEVKDPVLLHHPTRKSVGYFGAVRLRDGKFLYEREPTCFDAVTTWKFLRKLRHSSRRSGRRVMVITDNAKYHHAKMHADWRTDQEPQFTLSYLPPYSPDLNPIERVWKLTRRLCLHNRYFSTLEEVVIAVEEQFSAWAGPNDALRRLCTVS
jgi:transposase